MTSYDGVDDFLNIANRPGNIKKEEELISSDIGRDVVEFSEQIKEEKDMEKLTNEIYVKLKRKDFIKRTAVAMALFATVSAGMITTFFYANDVHAAVVDKNDLNDALHILGGNVNMILNAREFTMGLFGEGNSVADYKTLNVTSVDEVYVYKYVSVLANLGKTSEIEFNKFIRAVSYYGSNGEICFYSNFEEFLKINGFNSEKEFKIAAEKSILLNYRKGKIKELPFEGVSTLNMIVKGGR